MSIVVKKKNLKWIIIGIIITIVLFFVISSAIQKSIEKERAKREYDEYIDRSIKREYKDLIREYEMYKESFEDTYYDSTRKMYIEKINKLLGRWVLAIDKTEIKPYEDAAIREALKDKAKKNVYNEIYDLLNSYSFLNCSEFILHKSIIFVSPRK